MRARGAWVRISGGLYWRGWARGDHFHATQRETKKFGGLSGWYNKRFARMAARVVAPTNDMCAQSMHGLTNLL